MATVTSPILTDDTFADKMDDLIAAVQPQASGVGVSTANMHYITEDDAQGALAELDAECYSLSNSLTQKASKAWTKIGDYSSTTAVSIDLSGYSEVMLVLASTADNLVIASATYPIALVTSKTVNVYWYYNGLKFGRISNSGTKAYVGDINYPMTIYAR